ncbi:MAG: hypothetical protein K0S61_1818 [Anaerocolumna sp.]|jgi:hypothetical protein|nr:hypothetical protein [Anaerocolumna sp.]
MKIHAYTFLWLPFPQTLYFLQASKQWGNQTSWLDFPIIVFTKYGQYFRTDDAKLIYMHGFSSIYAIEAFEFNVLAYVLQMPDSLFGKFAIFYFAN